jgi:hypothetical protein
LAVHVTDALPLAAVVAVVEESAQLAPEAGAVKVTETPLTGLPAFVTLATNGLLNAVSTVVLCPPPLVAVRIVVTTAVFVRAKLAGVFAPDVEAVTL